jgi:hypothetical protein
MAASARGYQKHQLRLVRSFRTQVVKLYMILYYLIIWYVLQIKKARFIKALKVHHRPYFPVFLSFLSGFVIPG